MLEMHSAIRSQRSARHLEGCDSNHALTGSNVVEKQRQ